jgi:hypothetical protein
MTSPSRTTSCETSVFPKSRVATQTSGIARPGSWKRARVLGGAASSAGKPHRKGGKEEVGHVTRLKKTNLKDVVIWGE